MATLQKTKPSAFGYKRAAYSVFSLDRPVTELVASGTLRKVHGIGPSSERIITEWIEKGASAAVEDALAKSATSVQADIQKRRAARDAFLSWSSVLGINQARMAPPVASMSSYRGDFQMHTTWSDGAEDVESMADACLARGWTRMCVTDHSYGLPIARGMSMEHVRRQHLEIEKVNERYAGRFRVLKGIEANILADGRVDMEPGELALFDLVIASPHSALRGTHDQTARMLAAVRTPGVHILGHARGRVFNKRGGVHADWDRVFAAASESGVAIELDGTWDRQDVDWRLAARALDARCTFAIDSDAHASGELEYVDYGMAHARLAAIPADRVINCWDDERLDEWRSALGGRARGARARLSLR